MNLKNRRRTRARWGLSTERQRDEDEDEYDEGEDDDDDGDDDGRCWWQMMVVGKRMQPERFMVDKMLILAKNKH